LRFIAGAFRYNEDSATPLLVVASGCGIGPVLSILDHRRKSISELGQCYVLYNQWEEAATEVIDELEKARGDGVIDQLLVAGPKNEGRLEVGALISAHADLVWKLWNNEGTELFYCGPALEFDSVREAMFRVISDKTGQSRLAALRALSKHKIYVQGFE
jgi:ferredoxin-NADP reductase